jgi:hypothetical protein
MIPKENIEILRVGIQEQFPLIQWDQSGYYIFMYHFGYFQRLLYYNPKEHNASVTIYQIPSSKFSKQHEPISKCSQEIFLDSENSPFLRNIELLPQVEFLKNKRPYYGFSRQYQGYRIENGSKHYFSLMDIRPYYYKKDNGIIETLRKIPNPPDSLNRYVELFNVFYERILNQITCNGQMMEIPLSFPPPDSLEVRYLDSIQKE